jgi:hypothetical protein
VMRSQVAVSEQRACGLIQIHRGTYRCGRRPEAGQLRVRLRQLAEERRRFGYRRLQGATGARRMGGKPQADVAVVCGAEAGLRCKARTPTGPRRSASGVGRRPSRARYGLTSRRKRSPADGSIVDDEQLFIFDSENRHLLRVTVISYTVSMRSMGFTENDVQERLSHNRN